MSVEIVEDVAAKLLTIQVSGKLSAEDYETLEPRVDAMMESCGRINILFLMHDFHGWELGAVWEDIKFATKHCSDINKVAMVGEKSWEKWMATICKPFTKSSIKYFDADDSDAAREWVNSE